MSKKPKQTASFAIFALFLGLSAPLMGNSLWAKEVVLDEPDNSQIYLSAPMVPSESANSMSDNYVIQSDSFIQATVSAGAAESAESLERIYRQKVIVTAYSSTPDQTDATPFITAAGTRVRDGIVAANFLPFGTRVRFPQLFGDKIFVVEDRMALKNSHKIDIWFSTRQQALQFGVEIAEIVIFR